MLAKFSVKKPMTVLVAVVLILILGFVAFSHMTTDLLPDINLPYVIVVTAYPGASPEAVEREITKPMEAQMATLDDISSVSSTSAENFSMVMLEFANSVNMDTVTGDIREKINQISGAWDEMVTTPTILKLNPSMIPVAVVAVSKDGMDVNDLSTFVDDKLMMELEGIEGVAGVTASGVVEETIEIRLEQDMIDAVNAKIRAAIDQQFAEGEEELADGLDQIEDGISQAESAQDALPGAKAQLAAAQVQLYQKIAEGENQLDEKQMEMLRAELQINEGMQTLLTRKTELLTVLNPILPVYENILELEKAKEEAESYIGLCDANTAYEQEITAYLLANPLVSREDAIADLLENGTAEFAGNQVKANALAALGGYDAEAYTAAQMGKAAADAGLTAVSEALAVQGTTIEEVKKNVTDLQAGIALIDAQSAELEKTLEQMKSGAIALDEARVQLQSALAQGQSQINAGLMQVVAGESTLPATISQLEATKAQLEETRDQIKDAKEAAYDQADAGEILSMSNLSMILYAQNFSMPAGYITDAAGDSYLVRVGDELDAEQLESLLLVDLGMEDLEPIYLSDVARIETVDNAADVYAKIDGANGVMLSFSKQSNYSTTVSANNVKEELARLEKEYEGLHFISMLNQGDYIDIVVDSVLNNLLVGAVLAIIILLIFLWDIRPTFIVACSIPISLTFALTLMYFSGVTLNVISLAGLAVAVGMLVDNSIVVIENIYRLRSLGASAKEAAIKGASQVAAAITSSTLTTVCVFAPIVFVQGLTRQLFADMALTITYSLGASLMIALTLVPAMSGGMLRRKTRQDKVRAHRGYRKILSTVLRVKPLTLGLALILLVASAVAGIARGFTYMPEMASTEIMVTVKMTDEDVELEDTRLVCDTICERIRAMEGVTHTGVTLSSGVASVIGLSMGGGEADPSGAMIYVLVDEDQQIYGLEERIAACADDLPCEMTVTGGSSMSNYSSALGGSGVQIEIYANDLDVLQESARKVAAALAKVEGIAEAEDGIGETTPEVRIRVNKEEAMKHGLTVAQVFQTLSADLKESSVATSITVDETDLDVEVFNASGRALQKEELADYIFTVTKQDGEKEEIRLSEIADIVETESMSAISRSEQRRYLTVTGMLEEGYNVTNVTAEAQREIRKMDLPRGVNLQFTGENETIMDAMTELLKMLLLGIAIIYLIMVAQFQSLLSPFIVMFTIPLAFTGGLFALVLCGMEISIVAMIGFIMLVGIIVNNGIVLVDYANQLRSDAGMSVHDAIIEAGATRLRPVLMTVMTTVLGLMPLALGVGYGADLVQPVAIVCIGGLLYATLMTLFIIPAMYEWFMRGQERRRARRAEATDIKEVPQA